MKTSSAIALGASLLALALPTAAQASTLGGVTESLGSAKVEAKLEVNGPIHAKAKAIAKVKARGAETRQRVETREGARLEGKVEGRANRIGADVRLKARVNRGEPRDLIRRTEAVREAMGHGRKAKGWAKGKASHKAKHVARSKRSAKRRLTDRSRDAAGHAERHVAAPGRGFGEPLAGLGREVGNPLQAGLAGGLLLGLGALAASVARAGFRRSLR